MISNPVMGGKSGGGSGGYTKVKAVGDDYIKSKFAYRPPEGGGEYPITVIGNLPETPCQPGSVFIMGAISGPLDIDSSAGITVSIDGDTLVLEAESKRINAGAEAT